MLFKNGEVERLKSARCRPNCRHFWTVALTRCAAMALRRAKPTTTSTDDFEPTAELDPEHFHTTIAMDWKPYQQCFSVEPDDLYSPF